MIRAHILLVRHSDGTIGSVAKATSAEILSLARSVRETGILQDVPVVAGDIVSTMGNLMSPSMSFRCQASATTKGKRAR